MTIQPPSLLRLEIVFAFLVLLPVAKGANPVIKDARELLSHSPWAVQVEATMTDPADTPEISSEVPRTITQAGQPNVGNGNLDINTRWDGGIGKNRRGHLATIPVLVRWDSASIIRHALAMRHEDIDELAVASQNSFVLTVVGLLPAKNSKDVATIQPKSSSDETGSQARGAEETLEWFMSKSLIQVKGIGDLHPQNVKVDTDTGTVHLFFNRSDKLLSNRHDADFVTSYGSMNVQARFRLKDMTVAGKPDL